MEDKFNGFKPGNIVVDEQAVFTSGITFQLTDEYFVGITRRNDEFFKRLKHWTPDGKWCWVYNNEPDLTYLLTNKAYLTEDNVIKTHDSCSWDHCIPFDGSVPKFIIERLG